MNKHAASLLAILALIAIFFLSTRSFVTSKPFAERDLSFSLPSFSLPSLKIFSPSDAVIAAEAWQVFENYLEFARTHDLAGVRSLSHQISETCNEAFSAGGESADTDGGKEKECFALMDSVYSFAAPFKLSDFKHIQSDERQIIMYTDGPTVTMLYFTRSEKDIKVLGMRFCFEDEASIGTCVKTETIKHDSNNNGWWDSVESLFY